MSEWQEVMLQDVISVLGDGLHGTPEYDDNGDYYFINGNNLSNGKIVIKEGTKKTVISEYEKYKKELNNSTILVSINGTLGNVALYNNEKCILGKSACYFNVLENIEKSFIRYVVSNWHFQIYISEFAHGTTIKNVSLKTLREYPFLLPPLPEQKAIAAVLSSLDNKIDLLHRQNQTLEAMAETLFRQWFVVEAQEDWEEGCLGDIATFHNGKKRPDDSVKGNVPIYGGNGILGYSVDFNYEGTTIIIGRVGAYCGSLYIEYNPVWITDNALVSKPKIHKHSSFLFYLLKNLSLNEMAEGSSHPLLTQTLLKSIPIFIPPNKVVESFVYQVDIFLHKININNNNIRTLETLRDTLLPKLMSGEVRVSA